MPLRRSSSGYPAVPVTKGELDRDSRQLTDLLKGKVITRILRPRVRELMVELSDGSRLFVDGRDEGLETSVT